MCREAYETYNTKRAGQRPAAAQQAHHEVRALEEKIGWWLKSRALQVMAMLASQGADVQGDLVTPTGLW